MDNTTERLLSATVDRLAFIKAQLAELKHEENALRDALIDAGLPVIEGTQHRAAVTYSAGHTLTDWQTIALKFKPSRQLITAHTSTSDPFHTVKLSAHKTR